ncbi:MAG: bifunctional riboflavin kinase/FAD synthetase [Paludibacteraceae bacterium]|nr:bifunctional riboflavin kinase/FAD synthetase [Paludibacteraceae bacterium]
MERIATIGMFDGVHRGHQFLLRELLLQARQRGWQSMVVTFFDHPRNLLYGTAERLLTTRDERKALLEACGVDKVVMLEFSDIQQQTAEEFMRFLRERYDVSAVMMGYDHRFGSDRLTRYEDYVQAGKRAGVEVIHFEEATSSDLATDAMNDADSGEKNPISSSRIRKALQAGEIEAANEMLGREYSLYGKVVHGKGLGTRLGFPTANISLSDPDKLLPKDGVYVVETEISGIVYRAVMNIGTNPTVQDRDEPRTYIEVHIIGFEGNLYNQLMRVEILHRLRDEQRFDSLEALRSQIEADIRQSETLASPSACL